MYNMAITVLNYVLSTYNSIPQNDYNSGGQIGQTKNKKMLNHLIL